MTERASAQIPAPLRQLIEQSTTSSQRCVGQSRTSVADHRIKRSAAEILTSTRQIVDALRLTGTRTEAGEDVGLAKRTEVVATMRDRRCGGVLSMA